MKLQDITLFESYSTAKQVFSRNASPDEVTQRLAQFKELNQRNMLKPEEKDLGKWIKSGWENFSGFVSQASSRTSGKAQKVANKKDSVKVYENDKWLVVVPLSRDASCFYGKETKWCTAATGSRNLFDVYFHDNNMTLLYCINKHDGAKQAAAFNEHLGTWECYNADDKRIPITSIAAGLGVEPEEMVRWVEQHAGKTGALRNDYRSAKSNETVQEALQKVEELTPKVRELIAEMEAQHKTGARIAHRLNLSLDRLWNETTTIHNVLKGKMYYYEEVHGGHVMVAAIKAAIVKDFMPKYTALFDMVDAAKNKFNSIEDDALLSQLGA